MIYKSPKHPIYSNGYEPMMSIMLQMSNQERMQHFTEGVKDATIQELKKNPDTNAGFYRYRAYSETIQRIEVIQSGHQLVQMNTDHFNESLSVKTISKLKPENIQLPYKAFTIDLSGAEWAGSMEFATVSKFEGQMVIRLEDYNDNWFLVLFAENISIEDTISQTEVLKNSVDISYKILSIIMYLTTFKREKNRVDIRSVKARSPQGIAKYRTSINRLIQPEYSLIGKKGGSHKKEMQGHIVRGHWRSQPVGKRGEGKTKPIFIKAFWKGEGRDQNTRVIKI